MYVACARMTTCWIIGLGSNWVNVLEVEMPVTDEGGEGFGGARTGCRGGLPGRHMLLGAVDGSELCKFNLEEGDSPKLTFTPLSSLILHSFLSSVSGKFCQGFPHMYVACARMTTCWIVGLGSNWVNVLEVEMPVTDEGGEGFGGVRTGCRGGLPGCRTLLGAVDGSELRKFVSCTQAENWRLKRAKLHQHQQQRGLLASAATSGSSLEEMMSDYPEDLVTLVVLLHAGDIISAKLSKEPKWGAIFDVTPQQVHTRVTTGAYGIFWGYKLGFLGSIDANTGSPDLGWDTDQFPTDVKAATLVMKAVLEQRGLAPGGLNFDAKVRRESPDVADMFIGHIGAMDTFARGLVNAAKIITDGLFEKGLQ
ncbi:unnamed protein product, partial [Notodromas monacha]